MKRSLMFACVVLLSFGVPGHAQERAPNRIDVVRAVAEANPTLFQCAHVEGRPCRYDWIKEVAKALHQIDARWGLNGKRGNANDLSMDVVDFRVGPTDRHVQVFDVCGACGGGNPVVTWNEVTDWAAFGQPGTAVWINPGPATSDGGGTGGGAPTSPPVPVVDLKPLQDAVAALRAELSARLDELARAINETRAAAQSAEHDAREVNAWRMEPAQPAPMPCLVGRVPKAFGGSTEVTFCPAQR